MKIIALSADIPQFQYNRIFDKNWAKLFPGAEWGVALKKVLGERYQLVTSDVALSHIKTGFCKADNVMVIQHTTDKICEELLSLGCHPHIITVFESPLYAGNFYDYVDKYTSKFSHKILFNGLLEKCTGGKGKNNQVHFPSYEHEKKNDNFEPWIDRKFLVTIFGNKYVPLKVTVKRSVLRDNGWIIYRKVAQLLRGAHHAKTLTMWKLQLQDKRLELLSYFLEYREIDLFGKGWDNLKNLPPYWRDKLNILSDVEVKTVDYVDKKNAISRYRFCLCLENVSYPGYVTEKIFDCLVAGVIPVYEGAPDIEQFVPPECFIDIRKYPDLNDLRAVLYNMTEKEANRMIEAGQEFLRSAAGKRHSYEGFAGFISGLIEERSDNVSV
jgi:hypothetical protein